LTTSTIHAFPTQTPNTNFKLRVFFLSHVGFSIIQIKASNYKHGFLELACISVQIHVGTSMLAFAPTHSSNRSDDTGTKLNDVDSLKI